MAVTKDMLVSELQDLLRLTAFEQTIASMRRVQAASSAVSEELKANADKARERQQLLIDALRQTGAVPDVVGAALGKAGAFVQTQVNQVQTLQAALLGDLALEHELRERARYARALAETLGYTQVIPVLDRLEVAHTATIEWLEQRLAEVARTGTSALRATPIQLAVGAARRTAGLPLSLAVQGVNRASSLLGRGAVSATAAAGDVAGSAVSTVAGAAAEVADRALATPEDREDALAAAAEKAAENARQAAERVSEDVPEQDVLDLTETQQPFPAYDRLTGDSVIRHVSDSEDVEHLREVQAFEHAHKSRKGVLQAVEARLGELSATV